MRVPAFAAAVGWSCLAAAVAAGAVPAAPAAPALGRLTYVEQKVEQGASGSWRDAREGGALRIGEEVRTALGALVRVDFSWMSMTVGSSSVLRFPDGFFLQALLGQGRVALRAERREILKLLTDEAEVRGRGHVVVRRREGDTLVSSLAGRFHVEGAGRVVSVSAGTGTIVRAGRPPGAALPLPVPPNRLVPGDDPIYAAPGEPIRLSWEGRAAAYHVEVLAVGSDTVLIERDVEEPGVELSIRWPGAFRWRVASRDRSGLEGPPSSYGLICVDD